MSKLVGIGASGVLMICVLNFGASSTSAQGNSFPMFLRKTPIDKKTKHAQKLYAGRSSSGFGGVGTPVDMREFLKKLLEVRCDERHITVLLHYDRKYARMTKMFLDAVRRSELTSRNSSADESCRGRIEPKQGSVVLKLPLGSCGSMLDLRQDNDSTANVYSAQVTVQIGRSSNLITNRTFQYDVQCIRPQDPKQMIVIQSLKLFGGRGSFNSPWDYPHPLAVGNEVWLQSFAKLPWYSGADLYSFPVECWTSQSPSDSLPKKHFVNEGCQVNDDKGSGLSSVHSFKLGPSRVRFNLGWYLLFTVTDNPLIYVHCRVIPCLQNYTKGLLNIPRCPMTRYCAGRPDESHFLPENLRDVPTTDVHAGPIIMKTSKRSAAAIDPKCKKTCPEVFGPSAQHVGRLREGPRTAEVHTTVYEGVSLKLTAVIAVCSLLLGMALMGGLWLIHTKTNPKKKLNRPGGRSQNSAAHPFTASNQSEHLPSTRLMLNPL